MNVRHVFVMLVIGVSSAFVVRSVGWPAWSAFFMALGIGLLYFALDDAEN